MTHVRSLVLLTASALLIGLGGLTLEAQQTGTVMPSPKFTGWDNSGLKISGGKLCSFLAGTTTPQSTYSDVALTTANANPVILDSAGRATVFLTPGASYKFILKTAGTDSTCNTGTTVWTQDNVLGIASSIANIDLTGTAGEAITAGQAAYLSAGDGGKTIGQWYKADAANTYSSSQAVALGIVPASIVSGASGTIRVAGTVTGLSLSPGTSYFVGTAGALTSTAPANVRALGIADTTTTLIMPNPGQPNSAVIAARGGTGATTLAAHGVLIGNGTSAVSVSGAGTTGQVLTSNGASADPTFQTAPAGLAFISKAVGTSTTASAVIFTKAFAAGELTAADSLQIHTMFNDPTGNCGAATIESSTDGVVMGTLILVNTSRGQSYRTFSIDGTTLTSVMGSGLNNGTGATTTPAITTNWTAAWTMVVKMGAAADGTSCNYNIRLYRLTGQ